MKISLMGVRGSIPTTGADKSYYGGNTSCTVVSQDDNFIVLDGGSGMQKVFLPDNVKHRVDIILTHLHLDHIQGLGFFSPLFNPSMEVHIWGPASATQTLHSRLSRYLSPPLFPVLLRDLPCKLIFHEIENNSFQIGPFAIESRYVIHPGPTIGLRISAGESVFAYIPDHEPALGIDALSIGIKWISGFDLVCNSDLLLHDGQFTVAEYETRIGWGHSSMEDTIRFASIAGAKHLLLTHHDPFHSDVRLNEIFSEVSKKINTSLKYELAVEGMDIELP